MDGGFWDDVCVEAVAKVDGVDIITKHTELAHVNQQTRPRASEDTYLRVRRQWCLATKQASIAVHANTATYATIPSLEKKMNSPFQVTVHNREEHLQEQVHRVDNNRKQVEPCFARHHDRQLSKRFRTS